MLIKAQKSVFSSINGENITKIKSSGYDFVELHEYTSGEDIKHIDWIISSKIGKPYVKVYQEQKELNIVIIPILCASINFGVRILKHDIITEICALLSFSCIRQSDPFSSYICNEDTMLSTQKSKSLKSVREFVEKVALYTTFTKTVNYTLLSSKLYTQLKQKSILFLIGDFFNTHEFDITALAMKHEPVVIIVRDKFEEDPTALGELHVIDPQTQQNSIIEINKKTSLKRKKELLKADTIFISKLKKHGVRFIKIYTDENPADKIITLIRSM